MRIGVEGAGQMGRYYLANLIEKLRIPPENVAVWDIAPERMAVIQAKYPGIVAATSGDDFASKADVFIVAVNTPAHHTEIERIARHGARSVLCESGTPSILCEKPLAQNVTNLRKIRALERRFKDLEISTALVIAFSPTRKVLLDLINSERLTLRVFGGRWGKNRGSSKELRPTAGDLVDEFVHMTEFGLGLVRHQGIRHVDVVAQVDFLHYVNAEAQRVAHERDPSFPIVPDHSTQALIAASIQNGETVQMSLASSFLEAAQVRSVWGQLAFTGTQDPARSFSIDFDVEGADRITLTEVQTDEKTVEVMPCDKLLALTEAFIESARSGKRDERLASVEWAGRFVELMEAIGESDRRRRAGKSRECRVEFQPRNWLGMRRA